MDDFRLLGTFSRSIDGQRRVRIPYDLITRHGAHEDLELYVQISKYKRACYITYRPASSMPEFSEPNFKLSLRENYDEKNKEFVMSKTFRMEVINNYSAKFRITLPSEIFHDVCCEYMNGEFRQDTKKVKIYGVGRAFYVMRPEVKLESGV